jgi:hypothetical protein
VAATNLTSRFVETVRPQAKRVDHYDARTTGLGLRVTPSGQKTWTLLFRFNGKMRRLTLGRHPAVSLAEARKLAEARLGDVAKGLDPVAAKAARRAAEEASLSFAALAAQYMEKHAKVHKRSWWQDERNFRAELLPRWGKVVCVKFSKKILGMRAQGKPRARSGALGESSAERPQRG